jgi:hypothetical protein
MRPIRAVTTKVGPAALLAIGVSALLVPVGCGSKPMSSAWRCTDITVDAAVDEWGETRRPLDEKNIILGVTNDAENLYLTFTPGDDAMQRQILMLGLTVWFDPQGAKNEYVGIRFPRGVRGEHFPFRGERPDISTQAGRKRIAAGMDSLEILRAGSREGDAYAIDELGGVAVRAQLVGDVFVYELKMPLARTQEHLYAIGAKPGDAIGIGLQTSAMDRRQMLEGMPGAGPPPGGGGPGGSGGGGSPGGRGGPGGPGGEGGGERGSGPGGFGPPGVGEGLDVWIQVRLAVPAACDPVTLPATPESKDDASTGSPGTP